MTGRLAALWRGEVPLSRAFWDWAVIGGLAMNVATTFGSMVLLMQEERVLAMVVGYGIPIPYNILVLVGVWRAIDRAKGNPRRLYWMRLFITSYLVVLCFL